MSIATILVALAGVITTGGGGYLVGLQLGRKSRRALEARTIELGGEVQRLSIQAASTQALQEQIRQLAAADRSGEQVESLRREIHHSLATMLERDREQKGLRELVLDMLGPLMESERRTQGLRTLRSPKQGRGALPAMLDTIAKRAGFAAVLLSDEVGLPLAASSGARNADVIAGVSSLILTLADRVKKAGGPIPTAVLVRDVSNQIILHRIFSVGEERFLLTAVAKGTEIPTHALDPALATLEDMLAKRAAA